MDGVSLMWRVYNNDWVFNRESNKQIRGLKIMSSK
uniref:Uncharacterized protein n=1 Tax=Anguilla anguilla TaxID=7936 RepID=A0A0E9R2E3_ANGAN